MAGVLVTADDCTGALEVAGVLADRTGRPVRALIGPSHRSWRSERVAEHAPTVVDLGSRHVGPDLAAERITGLLRQLRPEVVAHKFDSTLRGNWASEVVAAARATGRPALVVAALPTAGRICRDGVVLVDGVPVEDTAAGRDPRHPVRSSRPADHLRAAGASDIVHITTDAELAAWLDGSAPSVAVVDAASVDDLERIGARWRSSGRRGLLAGTAGSVAAGLVAATRGPRAPLPCPTADTVLVVCGSLHPVARRQVAELVASADPADRVAVATSAPPWPAGTTVGAAAASAAADELAGRARRALAARPDRMVVVLGGDTAAALLDGERLEVCGTVEPGAPWCRRVPDGRVVVTRSGGFGDPVGLRRLVSGLLTGAAAADEPGRGPLHGRMGR